MFCPQCGAPEVPGPACPSCRTPYVAHPPPWFPQQMPAGDPRLHYEVGPANCKRRDGHVSRNCSIRLHGGQILLSSGSPTTIPIGELLSVRREESYNGEHWGGCCFLVLSLRSQEIGILIKHEYAETWLRALNGQLH